MMALVAHLPPGTVTVDPRMSQAVGDDHKGGCGPVPLVLLQGEEEHRGGPRGMYLEVARDIDQKRLSRLCTVSCASCASCDVVRNLCESPGVSCDVLYSVVSTSAPT